MQVINNFLPRDEFLLVKNYILGNTLEWTLSDKSNSNEIICEEKFNLQFIHTFYHSPTVVSQHINAINPILKKINHQLMIRIKANITTCNDVIHLYGYHIDLPNDLAKISKTAIFYLNTNNGYTEFKKDHRQIPSIENSIVIFNSDEFHSGTNCTDQKYRAVINFNFI